MSWTGKHKVKIQENENSVEEPEFDSEFIKQMYDEILYNKLAAILGLSIPKPKERDQSLVSNETVRTFLPEYFTECVEEETVEQESLVVSLGSGYSEYSEVEEEVIGYPSDENIQYNVNESTASLHLVSELSDDLSQFVNHSVQSSKRLNKNVEKKRKALLKLLRLPVEEAASWRPKKIKTIETMTLEERGDFLINMITSNFCEWLRSLGGDEPSVIDENTLKELFQVGMDNPASKSIAVQIREKNALYQKLADLFGLEVGAFHNVLLNQLKEDLEAERKPLRLQAFGRNLPLDIRFRPPKNKTKETWFESKRLPSGEDNFEDVYREVAELRSTKEYCKWLINHPQYKKPKYLKSIGMFSSKIRENDSDVESTSSINQIMSEISMLSMESTSYESDTSTQRSYGGPF